MKISRNLMSNATAPVYRPGSKFPHRVLVNNQYRQPICGVRLVPHSELDWTIYIVMLFFLEEHERSWSRADLTISLGFPGGPYSIGKIQLSGLQTPRLWFKALYAIISHSLRSQGMVSWGKLVLLYTENLSSDNACDFSAGWLRGMDHSPGLCYSSGAF